MVDLRITASLMFALEMTRAVLAQQDLIPEADLTAPIGEMDIGFNSTTENPSVDFRKFYLTFSVKGVDHEFAFYCQTRRTENGWTDGWIIIDSLPMNPQTGPIRFRCTLENNRIITSPW